MEYDLKQVIVMRTDLNMRKGKMIAQGAHASMMFLAGRENALTATHLRWLRGSMAKICVRVDSEADLAEVYANARNAGLEAHIVTDAGHTEFHGVPTRTCLAIGPDRNDKIDAVTGTLKLL